MGIRGEFSKFARGVRNSHKDQLENSEKKLNNLFKMQLRALTSRKPEIPDDSDIEERSIQSEQLQNVSLDKLQETMNRVDYQNPSAQLSHDALKGFEGLFSVECKDDPCLISTLQEIPNFKRLLKKPKDEEEKLNLQVRVLKKVIRGTDERGKPIERIMFTADEKHVKSFERRMQKFTSKTRAKARAQFQDSKNGGRIAVPFDPDASQSDYGSQVFRIPDEASSVTSRPRT